MNHTERLAQIMERNKPQTIEAIKQTIEHCKTIQRLEQLTIEALERDLKKRESETLGDADRLFCRTKDIDKQIVGVKKE